MKQETKQKPFFARLLEQQEGESPAQGPQATQKYPSDSDEAHTHKYPSDGDEFGA